jgi:uncharacterized protein YhaN
MTHVEDFVTEVARLAEERDRYRQALEELAAVRSSRFTGVGSALGFVRAVAKQALKEENA